MIERDYFTLGIFVIFSLALIGCRGSSDATAVSLEQEKNSVVATHEPIKNYKTKAVEVIQKLIQTETSSINNGSFRSETLLSGQLTREIGYDFKLTDGWSLWLRWAANQDENVIHECLGSDEPEIVGLGVDISISSEDKKGMQEVEKLQRETSSQEIRRAIIFERAKLHRWKVEDSGYLFRAPSAVIPDTEEMKLLVPSEAGWKRIYESLDHGVATN